MKNDVSILINISWKLLLEEFWHWIKVLVWTWPNHFNFLCFPFEVEAGYVHFLCYVFLLYKIWCRIGCPHYGYFEIHISFLTFCTNLCAVLSVSVQPSALHFGERQSCLISLLVTKSCTDILVMVILEDEHFQVLFCISLSLFSRCEI